MTDEMFQITNKLKKRFEEIQSKTDKNDEFSKGYYAGFSECLMLLYQETTNYNPFKGKQK